MKKASSIVTIIIALALLTGCWDQTLLKEVRLFMTASFDLEPDGKIEVDVSSPILKREQQGAGTTKGYTVTSGIGNTPREARGAIDKKASRTFEASKLRVLVIGSDLAKTDIYSVLDLFYRDPKSSLSSRLVVSEGKGKEILGLNIKDEKIGEYLVGLLESQELISLIPEENIQSICAEMFDPGEDFVLPYLSVVNESQAKAEGIALFNEHKFSGKILTDDEAMIFLLMDGNAGKTAKFTKKVMDSGEQTPFDFVSFNVRKARQRLEVKVKNNQVRADINLNLKISLTDYSRNQLYKKGAIEKLNRKLSELLTKDAKDAIATILEANSDSFGIGRRLMALHPDYWKQVEWKEEYPNIKITPKVEVTIIGHGIIE